MKLDDIFCLDLYGYMTQLFTIPEMPEGQRFDYLFHNEFEGAVFPIVFRQKKGYGGNKLVDFLNLGLTTFGPVSDRVIDLLRDGGFTGWGMRHRDLPIRAGGHHWAMAVWTVTCLPKRDPNRARLLGRIRHVQAQKTRRRLHISAPTRRAQAAPRRRPSRPQRRRLPHHRPPALWRHLSIALRLPPRHDGMKTADSILRSTPSDHSLTLQIWRH